MKRLYLILLITFSSGMLSVSGQGGNFDTSLVLQKLFSAISSDLSDAEKISKNDSIQLIIDSYVKSDSVFRHKFSNLRYLGQIVSKDMKLKIIAWNLLLNESESRYYCYFINNRKEGNKIFKLNALYSDKPPRRDTVYTRDNWYGALYYDLRPVKKDNQIFWVLLGIDYGNRAITRKIIDVLSFTPDGQITFGRKWFQNEGSVSYREVLEYGYTAVISLRFLSDKLIVFDHLVPLSPEYKENREFYGPDFSYDAYRYEKGAWRYKVNYDVRNPEK